MNNKIIPIIALAAGVAFTSCEDRLDEPFQHGVDAIENFYKTDADCEKALASAYEGFLMNTLSRTELSGNPGIWTPNTQMLNYRGDDILYAGGNYGDHEWSGELNEFRLTAESDVPKFGYSGLYLSVYTCNLVIDKFKDASTQFQKQAVAEARVLRAYDYFLLANYFDTPPIVDHLLAGDAMPVNSDTDRGWTKDDILAWVISELQAAEPDLTERKDVNDKDGAVRVTKGFANALIGKTYLFLGKYSEAKTALKKVIDSGKYALVPGDRYLDLFHIEGDGCEEKIFEANLEYNAGISDWGGANWNGAIHHSTWMEANQQNWRAGNFQTNPCKNYTGLDGWGGCGVPQWFGDEFFENDGHSKRFDATLMHIDDAVYHTSGVAGMSYQDEKLQKMSADELKNSKEVGIKDVGQGLYGQSFWLPFKNVMSTNDVMKPDGSGLAYGDNNRLNNIRVMRYAEVDAAEAKKYVNMIQERAGSKTISDVVDMEVLKKEKSYELWYEGCRFFDVLRWKDQKGLENLKNAGQKVPHLFDKLFRTPKPDEQVVWEHGSESNSRFYNVYTHEGKDAGFEVGFKAGKHEFFPIPQTILDKNPKMHQNKAWEGK